MYGAGFGATNPFVPAGGIIGQQNTLPNIEIRFGDRVAMIRYAGLAPGFVRLYQFSVEVPSGVTGDCCRRWSRGGAGSMVRRSMTVRFG